MINVTLKIISFLVVIIATISFKPLKHPVKFTTSLVEYNNSKKTLYVETRVFIDDFLMSLKDAKGISPNLKAISKVDESKINEYYNDDFQITLNKKNLVFKYYSLEVMEKYNVAILKFSFKLPEVQIGTNLQISNTLFFKQFGYVQSNHCTIRFAPFLEEESHTFTINDGAVFTKRL